mgnify:CR=1 FL=1
MTDNIDAGEMAAQEMLTMLHDAGNSPQEPLAVGILLSSDASQAMVNRVSGFLDYWAKYAPTKWEITKRYCFKWRGCGKSRVGCSETVEEK